MVRVLIAEDSPVVRQLLVNIFENDPEICVAGIAKNGIEAVTMAENLRPDVITMDIRMPKMDGVEATQVIMENSPTRIIVVSASVNKEESRPAFEAMKAGALTLVEKPRGLNHKDFESIKANLIATVKNMSGVKVVRRRKPRPSRTSSLKRQKVFTKILAVGASTGGPAALSHVLKGMPKNFSIPILLVQHMTSGFGAAFSAWLDKESPIPVKTARPGDELKAGCVFVAPDNYHVGVNETGRVILSSRNPSYNHHRPSIDYMFGAVARSYGPKAIGILLTGMGEDGALGLREIKKAGGKTIVQDESSSIVFGMPKSAISMGAADQVVPLDKIAQTILALI